MMSGLRKLLKVNSEDVCSISTSYLKKKLRKVSPQTIDAVEDRLKILLGCKFYEDAAFDRFRFAFIRVVFLWDEPMMQIYLQIKLL